MSLLSAYCSYFYCDSETKYPEVNSYQFFLSATQCMFLNWLWPGGKKKNPEMTNQESLKDLRLCLGGRFVGCLKAG